MSCVGRCKICFFDHTDLSLFFTVNFEVVKYENRLVFSDYASFVRSFVNCPTIANLSQFFNHKSGLAHNPLDEMNLTNEHCGFVCNYTNQISRSHRHFIF